MKRFFFSRDKGKTERLFFETQVESKNNFARDRGKKRASIQDKVREKIFNVQETKGKTELVFETEVESKSNCARYRGGKSLLSRQR